MKKIKLHGVKVPEQAQTDYTPTATFSDSYEKVETYQLNAATRAARKTIEIEGEHRLIELVFEDGTEWLAMPEEISALFPNEATRGKEDAILIPDVLTFPTPNQRGLKKFFLKLVRLYTAAEAIKEDAVTKLGVGVDEKIKDREVLYRISDASFMEEFEAEPANESKYLLLLHGFLSSTKGSFGDFAEAPLQGLWSKMRSIYQKNILGYDHHTISKSPIQNAIDLLELLPDKAHLDILSFSRGGLIADLLAKCSVKGTNPDTLFSQEDYKRLDDKQQEDLKKLEQLAEEKQIQVDRVIRVACPARGTVLLDKRLDYFLNVILSGIKFIPGAVTNPIYWVIKGFLMETLKARLDPERFPGVAAMVPDSAFQQFINQSRRKTKDELLVIEGDSQFGNNLKQSLLVLITNLSFFQKNDFVVNTDSMRFGIKRAKGVQVFLSQDAFTTHFKYFENAKSQTAITNAMEWDGASELPHFESITKEQLEQQFEDDAFEITARSGSEAQEDMADLLTKLHHGGAGRFHAPEINITITHADLKFANYPVLVGHFAEDGIVSAERALNRALDNKLSDRFLFGTYPAYKNESLVIINTDAKPKGGIIIGMGERINFTEAELRKAVENGILEYAIYLRDSVRTNAEAKHYQDFSYQGITSLFIGSSYGSLDMQASLTAILFGVSNANEKIQGLNKINETKGVEGPNGSKYIYPITEIEFIDLFEDVTRRAFYSLMEVAQMDYALNINIPTKINTKHGNRKRIQYRRNTSWWHNIMTETTEDGPGSSKSGIRFMTSSGKAKVVDITDFFSTQLVEHLIREVSTSPRFLPESSNSLYHLLIPRRIQEELKNQSNILWKMTAETAQYPWEMIHNKDFDEEPVFVNSGMIRQLVSSNTGLSPKIIREQNALIIGDPIYEKYNQLPAALAEAQALHDKLVEEGDWRVQFLPNARLSLIVSALLNSKFKLLHIAGHGVYEPDTGQTGIVVGNTVLDSVFFNKLPYLPEFAFINCCFTGDIDPSFEETYQDRYKLAASIGVQLIEMGVQAVVITGWAVHDRAAKDFANEFYRLMLQGEYFGRAVQRARKEIYTTHRYSNTWAAYQCYGDPWYKLVKTSSPQRPKNRYWAEDEVLVDLYNVLSEKINKFEKKEEMLEKAQQIFEAATNSNMVTPVVYEKMAEIYAGFDELSTAIDFYEKMLRENSAEYSVKGLEQYCNLRIKKFVEDMELKRSQKEAIEKVLEDKDSRIIKDFELLLKIFPTAERHNLLGSAYKRLAYVFENNQLFLEGTVNNYEAAYDQKENDVRTYTYPLSNLLQAQFFLSEGELGATSKDKAAQFLSPIEWIEDSEQKLRKVEVKHQNFWEDIAPINILTTKLLYVSDGKTVEEAADEIIARYAVVFSTSGTLQYLRSEIEQFDFLIRMLERIQDKKHRHSKNKALTKKKHSQLERIRTTLKQFNHPKTQA
ncbi:MAG: CHAT domain-containing protein [Bacteroidota bacterium]